MAIGHIRGAVGIALASLLIGCGTFQLDLGPAKSFARREPIGDLASTAFDLGEVDDERIDRSRVGTQKNAYGMNVFDVLTTRPVTDLFREVFAAQLEGNGHRIDASGRFRIEVAITFFWAEMQPAFGGVTAVSTSSCRLRVIDRESDEVIHQGEYTGHYQKAGSGAFEGDYRRALSAALERMIREFSQDAALVEALRGAMAGPGPIARHEGGAARAHG